MREVLITNYPEIDMVLNYLIETSGKMLRPRLVHLVASLYPHDEDVIVDLAIAVELIHMASLIHDDIIDQSLTRRGKESINGKWGNQVSVLTGDFLFATAFRLVNQHNMMEVINNLTQTIQIMCSGEIKQLSMLFDTSLSEEDYYDKTYRKTACLFASSCKVGALASSMPAVEATLLEQYGLCLGYAYQIIDDVLDFVADKDLLGKPVGTDLLQGNLTLPVLLALKDETHGVRFKQLIQSGTMGKEKIPQVVEILTATNAVQESIRRSRVFLQVGMDLLSELPANPSVKKLQDLAIYLLEGYYQKAGQRVWGNQGRSQSGEPG